VGLCATAMGLVAVSDTAALALILWRCQRQTQYIQGKT